MFDNNQYIEQPSGAAQPAQNSGSGFAQEGHNPTGPPATPAPSGPIGMDDPQAMDDLAKSLDTSADKQSPKAANISTEPSEPASPHPHDHDVSQLGIDPELADIKQRALIELGPLVGQLDQAPEDKFKTVMMMIQASDNQGLINTAYETAHSIENETARARALLDVVNEINYFSSKEAT